MWSGDSGLWHVQTKRYDVRYTNDKYQEELKKKYVCVSKELPLKCIKKKEIYFLVING